MYISSVARVATETTSADISIMLPIPILVLVGPEVEDMGSPLLGSKNDVLKISRLLWARRIRTATGKSHRFWSFFTIAISYSFYCMCSLRSLRTSYCT